MSSEAAPGIQEALVGDAGEILALQRLAFRTEAELYDDWTIPPLTETIDQLRAKWGRVRVLKAVAEGRIVGSVQANLEDGVCYINRLMVHPGWRRRGLARALMAAIEAGFPEAERFRLATGSRSENNLALYRRLGYRPAGEERLSDRVVLVAMEKPNARL